MSNLVLIAPVAMSSVKTPRAWGGGLLWLTKAGEVGFTRDTSYRQRYWPPSYPPESWQTLLSKVTARETTAEDISSHDTLIHDYNSYYLARYPPIRITYDSEAYVIVFIAKNAGNPPSRSARMAAKGVIALPVIGGYVMTTVILGALLNTRGGKGGEGIEARRQIWIKILMREIQPGDLPLIESL